MRKVILYIAVSLDGYIADSEGSVEWISGKQAEKRGDGRRRPYSILQWCGHGSLWEREPTTQL